MKSMSPSVSAWHVIVCLFCLSLSGCDGRPVARYDKLELVQASGQVTLNSNPLAGAVVTFEDPASGTFSLGLTDSSGNYTLQLDSVKSGVTVGPKVVRISTTQKIEGLNSMPEAGESSDERAKPGSGTASAEIDKVPARYNTKTELVAVVSASQTKFNFQLTSP